MKFSFRSTLPAILSAALALGSVAATPARADLSNFEKFAIGAGAMIVIGSAISNANRVHAAPPPRVVHVHPAPRVVHVAPAPRVVRVAPPPKRVVVLPRNCVNVSLGTVGGGQLLASTCLSRRGIALASLPASCKVIVRGHSAAYVAPCLQRHGFRLG